MASSPTVLANMAFAHLGKGTYIENLESDNSAEGKLARLFYAPVLKSTQRDWHWPFNSRIEQAQLIETDPTSEWGYSYKYPVKCLEVRRFLSGVRDDDEDSAVNFRLLGHDTHGIILLTDAELVEMEFTKYIENTALFPADFELAYTLRYAGYMAPKISGGDAEKMSQSLLARANQEIATAKINAATEERRAPRPTPAAIRARG